MRIHRIISRSVHVALSLGVLFSLTSCVDPISNGTSTSSSFTNAASTKPEPRLDKHDVALRFLTAFVRLDRRMALQYATPEAVASLDWNRPHGGNVPYYDDKMILHYTGGWARVYFQEVNGSYLISRIEAHRR